MMFAKNEKVLLSFQQRFCFAWLIRDAKHIPAAHLPARPTIEPARRDLIRALMEA